MAIKIGRLLDQALERLGAADQVRAAQILVVANSVLQQVFGADAAEFFIATAYRRGELQCTVRTPAAATALRQREQEVVSGVRQQMPRIRIERLSVRVQS